MFKYRNDNFSSSSMSIKNDLINGDIGFNNEYEVGDRIGQLIILPYPQIEFQEVDDLGETERGDGGFGSSGR
jgi:dUTP pyrophosphatase